MSNRIYYFSATGNTLSIARTFAAELGDTEVISIADLDRTDEVSFEGADTVGIFFPVYCFGVPSIVQKFVERIQPGYKGYVYSFCTCSGMKGSAANLLEDLLKKLDIKLANEFSTVMPSNYIPQTVLPPDEHIQKQLAKAEKEAKGFATQVRERKHAEVLRIYPFDIFSDLVAKRAVDYLSDSDYDRWFWTTEQCDSCGLCEKICPESNIVLMNNIPVWRGHCTLCMGCIQWCPKEAVQFRQVTLNRKRYHHPDIKAEDMILKICK